MTYDLEFITPAFLCGANQAQAEVRPASIRGQLRWWYRVLGADSAEERQLFGGVHGSVSASKVVIRVSDVCPRRDLLPQVSSTSNLGYIYHFATASGTPKGIRTGNGAYFSPGTTFKLSLIERRPLSGEEKSRLDLSVQCFARLGGLGLRMTRGYGALAEKEVLSREEFLKWCMQCSSTSLLVRSLTDEIFESATSCQSRLGGFLKDYRQAEHLSGKKESALGYSIEKLREASALHLRPVKVREGFLAVLVYTDVACSQPSQRSALETYLSNHA